MVFFHWSGDVVGCRLIGSKCVPIKATRRQVNGVTASAGQRGGQRCVRAGHDVIHGDTGAWGYQDGGEQRGTIGVIATVRHRYAVEFLVGLVDVGVALGQHLGVGINASIVKIER